MTTVSGIHSKRRWQVRNIFLTPRDSYSLYEAAKRVSIKAGDLRKEIEAGRMQAVCDAKGEWRLTWSQLVRVALTRWPMTDIESDLGEDAAAILPELARSERVEVTLPRYITAMLSAIAVDERRDVGAVLFRLLEPLAREGAARFEETVPGFKQAALFPQKQD